MKIIAIAAALFTAASGSAALADSVSYTGNWQVTLTNDVFPTTKGYTGHRPDSTHCISLTDDGSVGWPHSGYAIMDHSYNSSGQFAVIGHTILIYVYALGSGQEPASLVFSGRAKAGEIDTRAAFDNLQGGESFDAADATFGAKGSC
jgi:hypothetical protein